MCNFMKSAIGDWCSQNQGVCAIAAELDEKILTGFNNVVGPRVFIIYLGEDAGGDESVKELLDMSIRHFDILIQRGKMLTFPRNAALTTDVGPSRNFYDLVEELRDLVRCLEFPTPMVIAPIVYNSTRPSSTDAWMTDGFTTTSRMAVSSPYRRRQLS